MADYAESRPHRGVGYAASETALGIGGPSLSLAKARYIRAPVQFPGAMRRPVNVARRVRSLSRTSKGRKRDSAPLRSTGRKLHMAEGAVTWWEIDVPTCGSHSSSTGLSAL